MFLLRTRTKIRWITTADSLFAADSGLLASLLTNLVEVNEPVKPASIVVPAKRLNNKAAELSGRD